MYEELARSTANDPEVLEVANLTPRRQPVMILMLASVHYLVLKSPAEPLASWYPTMTSTPRPVDEIFPVFREFVLRRREEIEQLVTTNRMQTNEVARCALFLPVFAMVAARAGRPLAVIEVGTSAGLNLMWDRYGYSYEDGAREIVAGLAGSHLQLRCEFRGEFRPHIPEDLPTVVHRIGLDLAPIDVSDADQATWLRATVWPDQPERHARLSAAIDTVLAAKPKLVTGDALRDVTALVAGAPQDAAVCILHSHVLNQLSPEDRDAFANSIANTADGKVVYRVSSEWLRTATSLLALETFRDGDREYEHLADVHHHGRWMEWLRPPA